MGSMVYFISKGGHMKSNVGFVIHLLIGHWLSVLIIYEHYTTDAIQTEYAS